jgi:hypothetical protein
MLYAKKAAVAKTPTTPARVVEASVVPTKVQALLEKWPTKLPTPAVTTGADGTITIPAAAFTSKNRWVGGGAARRARRARPAVACDPPWLAIRNDPHLTSDARAGAVCCCRLRRWTGRRR